LSVLLLWLILAGLVRQWPGRGLWYDETVNAYFAEHSWPDLWQWCTEIDNQMPLHFALLKLWASVAGTGEFSLRLFSVGCSLLAAAGVLALGRRVGGSRAAGVLAVLAFVLSQSFVYAAYEVRPYALALALYAWAGVFLWELWRRYADQPRTLDRRYTRLLIRYVLLALALIYTHYTAFLALAAHGFILLGRTALRRTRRQMIVLAHLSMALAAGYLPWLMALAGRDVRAGTAYAGRVKLSLAFDTYLDFYSYGQKIVPNDAPPCALALVILLVMLIAVWGVIRRHQPDTWAGGGFALVTLLVPLLGLLLMVYAVQAKLSGRHGWPVWIGIALVIGTGLAALDRLRLARGPLWAGALLLVALPSTTDFQPVYNSYLRETFAYMNRHAEPGDVLLLRDGTLFTAAGYYEARLPWEGMPPEPLTDVRRFLFFDEAEDQLTTLVNRYDARRVWVIEWQGQIMDPQNLTHGILEVIGDMQTLPDTAGFGDVSLSLYRLHGDSSTLRERVDTLQPVHTIPGGGPIFYGGYVLNQGAVPHGGIIQVHTWWKRGEQVMPGMRFSLRLYDSSGQFYTQLDQPPVSPSFGQENWPPDELVLSRQMLWVPAAMPAGPAEVKMVLYDMQGAFEPITVAVAPITIAE
jgi:hypothetical protein